MNLQHENLGRMRLFQKAPWTSGRIISAGVSLALFAFAAGSFIYALEFLKKFRRWEAAKPVDVLVDLSTPGEIIVPFHQTCSSAHNEVIGIRLPPSALEHTPATELLAGLKARIEVLHKSGTGVVQSTELDLSSVEDMIDGTIPLFYVSPFTKGRYDARLKIIAGAPALKGVSQRLEGRYLLCGLEAMPAAIAIYLGIGSACVGGLIALILLYRLKRVPVPAT